MHRIYYVSQGSTPSEHLEHIAEVCQAGCRLVQLRLKDCSWEEQLETAKAAREICDSHQALLIINDSVELGLAIGADGVHLGKTDMPPHEARSLLPANMLIGGTANTLEDCLRLISKGVDYIGLGPFRFTRTKQKLSPILGLEGYSGIMNALQKQGIEIPVYAIGGISEADFEELLKTGIEGFAVSGLLTAKSREELKRIMEAGNFKKNSNFRLQRNEWKR